MGYYEDSVDKMCEVRINNEDFLKIKETLTRIGIPSAGEKKITNTCHILHKRGKYYIVHFKEMFLLDGKYANITEVDYSRRNKIATILEEWDLLDLVDDSQRVPEQFHVAGIKIIPYSEKKDWTIVQKYDVGGNR